MSSATPRHDHSHFDGPVVSRRNALKLSAGIAASAVVGAALPGFSSVPAQALPTPFAIPNPSFESLQSNPSYPANWGFGSSGTAATASVVSNAHQGARSFESRCPSTSDRYTIQQYMKPASGSKYYKFGCYYQTSGTTKAPTLQLFFYDSNQNLISSHVEEGFRVSVGWEYLTIAATSPANTAYLTLSLCNYFSGGTVRWDDVSSQPYGANTIKRAGNADTLTLSLSVLPGSFEIEKIQVQWAVNSAYQPVYRDFRFTNATTITGSSGTLSVASPSGSSWNGTKKTLTVPARGQLIASGGLMNPQAGVPFPSIRLVSPTGATREVFALSSGRQPNYSAELTRESAILTSVAQASTYLESLRMSSGLIAISHPTWPGNPQPDPHGNAGVANVNMRMYVLTGTTSYRTRARDTLDGLLSIQKTSGAYGFPWAYGVSQQHFNWSAHYPASSPGTHPAGTDMAILGIKAGSAHLAGYRVFGDASYKTAARKALDHLFTNPTNGLKWLGGTTYASIPYCTHTPVGAGRPSSYQVYNIDGDSLLFLMDWRDATGQSVYTNEGDALARNLYRRIEDNGSLRYGAHNWSNYSVDYALTSFYALLRWGSLRGETEWVEAATRGLSWAAQEASAPPIDFLWDHYGSMLGGVDNTQSVLHYVDDRIGEQAANGSWSSNNTRVTAGHAAVLSALLLQAKGLTA